jgi:hypothetical protein
MPLSFFDFKAKHLRLCPTGCKGMKKALLENEQSLLLYQPHKPSGRQLNFCIFASSALVYAVQQKRLP